MIVYNVTLAIEPAIEQDFIQWLKEIHLPEVLATGLFNSSELFKVFEGPNKAHGSYAVQYRLDNWEKFQEYQDQYASALQAKTREKFGDNVLAYRTFLELQ